MQSVVTPLPPDARMGKLVLSLLVLIAASALGACADEPVERSGPAADPPAAASGARAQRLDPERVPRDLRHLVPMAERWGIGDDVDRNAKVDSATVAERDELRAAVRPHHERITEWLNSFIIGQMPDEAGAFMYMQLALEESEAVGLRQTAVSPAPSRPAVRLQGSAARSRKPAARKATPRKATPRKATPRKATPRKATPRKPTGRKATPRKPTGRKPTG